MSTKIDHSDGAAPIVAVKKQGKKVRVCAVLGTGLNAAIDMHKYPSPLPDKIFSKLSGDQH